MLYFLYRKASILFIPGESILSFIKTLFKSMIVICLTTHSLYSINVGVIPKIGTGFAYLNGIDNVRSRIAFTTGLGAILHFDDRFAVELDILYQLKGTQGLRSDYNLSYLSFPITFRVKFVEHLSLLVGPQVSFLLNANVNNVDVTSDTESIDVSIVFGMSYYFPMGDDRLIFDFLIEPGLIDISKANHPFSKTNNKTRSAYLVLGWEFSL